LLQQTKQDANIRCKNGSREGKKKNLDKTSEIFQLKFLEDIKRFFFGELSYCSNKNINLQ